MTGGQRRRELRDLRRRYRQLERRHRRVTRLWRRSRRRSASKRTTNVLLLSLGVGTLLVSPTVVSGDPCAAVSPSSDPAQRAVQVVNGVGSWVATSASAFTAAYAGHPLDPSIVQQAVLCCASGGQPASSTSTPVAVTGAPPAASPTPYGELTLGSVPGYTATQLRNAQLVAEQGIADGVPGHGILLGIQTAIGESDLTVVDHGDAAGPDSRGLFQQRAVGWGSYEQRMDPKQSAHSFYAALLKVPGWQTMTNTAAIHEVQRNADAGYYAADRIQGGAERIYAALRVNGHPLPAQPMGTASAADTQHVQAAEAAPVTVPVGCKPAAGTATGVSAADFTPAGAAAGHTVTVQGITVDASIGRQVDALLTAAHAAGINLSGSGWRSNERQKQLRVTNGCQAVMSGSCRVPTAIPGTSMHEKGLAIDFTQDGHTLRSSDSGFAWLQTHAAGYGLQNFPAESWHWSTNGH